MQLEMNSYQERTYSLLFNIQLFLQFLTFLQRPIMREGSDYMHSMYFCFLLPIMGGIFQLEGEELDTYFSQGHYHVMSQKFCE